MKQKPSETVVRAWARLTKAQQMALGAIEKALKAAELPPLSWYDVLLELERVGRVGCRPFELQRELLLAQHNLSRLIDRMEDAGYVELRVCDNDGRGHVLVITEAGKAMRRKMWPIYADAIRRSIGSRISEKQADALDTILGGLIGKSGG